MNTQLKIQCPDCKQWNQIDVQEATFEPEQTDPKIKAMTRAYLVQDTQRCKNCKTILAEPNEMFRIVNGEAVRFRMKNL